MNTPSPVAGEKSLNSENHQSHLAVNREQAATVSNAHRAYSVSDWQRDFAAAFGPTQARGPLLAADNDEPELTPEDVDAEVKRLEADMADMLDPWKARRAREEEAGQVERVMKPHLWEQS